MLFLDCEKLGLFVMAKYKYVQVKMEQYRQLLNEMRSQVSRGTGLPYREEQRLYSNTNYSRLLTFVGEWRRGEGSSREVARRWLDPDSNSFICPITAKGKFDDATSQFLVRAICRGMLFASPTRTMFGLAEDMCKLAGTVFCPGYLIFAGYKIASDKPTVKYEKLPLSTWYKVAAQYQELQEYALFGAPLAKHFDDVESTPVLRLETRSGACLPFDITPDSVPDFLNYSQLSRKQLHVSRRLKAREMQYEAVPNLFLHTEVFSVEEHRARVKARISSYALPSAIYTLLNPEKFCSPPAEEFLSHWALDHQTKVRVMDELIRAVADYSKSPEETSKVEYENFPGKLLEALRVRKSDHYTPATEFILRNISNIRATRVTVVDIRALLAREQMTSSLPKYLRQKIYSPV
jgi:hypothetical protein